LVLWEIGEVGQRKKKHEAMEAWLGLRLTSQFCPSRLKEGGRPDNFHNYTGICKNGEKSGLMTADRQCAHGGGSRLALMLVKLINEDVVQAQYRENRVPKNLATRLFWETEYIAISQSGMA
jgi:hypothetical protein